MQRERRKNNDILFHFRKDGLPMTKLSQLKIDPEFQGQINPPTADEEQQLEQNILEERRLLNPIITWNGYIVDGHTRYRILKKHQFIQFEVIEKDFANRFEVLAWICKNQLGRRNLTPEQKKFLIGRQQEAEKNSVGGDRKSQKAKSEVQNEPLIYTSTAARVAAEMGVSESYVKRAAKYARGVDAAEEAVPGAKNEILSGKLKATDAEIIALAQLSKEEIHATLDELRKPKNERQPKNRLQKVETTSEVQNISESNEPAEPPVAEDETAPSDDIPLNFRKSIQGHRHELTAPERKRLQKSIDNRFYRPKKDGGAVVMCEIQGAQEDFARRWERCFSDYPDLLTDAENKEQVQKYMERAIAYLQTVKARLDGGMTH